LSAGVTAIVVAVTAPVLSLAPRAATHLPTARALALARWLVVYVVAAVVVTVTGWVVTVGVALGDPVAAGPVPRPANVSAATVNPLPSKAVTRPTVICPKNRRP
jgi:hypothetical protein